MTFTTWSPQAIQGAQCLFDLVDSSITHEAQDEGGAGRAHEEDYNRFILGLLISLLVASLLPGVRARRDVSLSSGQTLAERVRQVLWTRYVRYASSWAGWPQPRLTCAASGQQQGFLRNGLADHHHLLLREHHVPTSVVCSGDRSNISS